MPPKKKIKDNDPRNDLNFEINCKFKNEKQKKMYSTIMENRITFVRGTAGTGKTLIALLTALKCLKNPDVNIDQIVLTKPIVEITSTKGLGALPGDINEKTLSYYTHFYDNLIIYYNNLLMHFYLPCQQRQKFPLQNHQRQSQ